MPLSADILSIQSLLIAEDSFIHSLPQSSIATTWVGEAIILHSQANAIIIIIIISIIIIIIIFVTIDIEKIMPIDGK